METPRAAVYQPTRTVQHQTERSLLGVCVPARPPLPDGRRSPGDMSSSAHSSRSIRRLYAYSAIGCALIELSFAAAPDGGHRLTSAAFAAIHETPIRTCERKASCCRFPIRSAEGNSIMETVRARLIHPERPGPLIPGRSDISNARD